jgi:microcystin-dependent protein
LIDISNALTGSVAADGQTPVTGNINMTNNKIVNLLNPSNLQDAATKDYVDSINAVMTGSIQMWPTTTAPTGYLLCNGAIYTIAAYPALYAVIGVTFGSALDGLTFAVPNYTLRFPAGATTASAFTGSISGNTLTVTATTGGPIVVGAVLSGGSIAPTTTITANLTGGFSGGVGTYSVSISQTLSSTALTGTNVYPIGATGGNSDAIVPAHTHTGTTGGQSVGHTHALSANAIQSDGAASYVVGGSLNALYGANAVNTTNTQSSDHNHGFTTNSTGVSAINGNIPPFIAMNFIIKT